MGWGAGEEEIEGKERKRREGEGGDERSGEKRGVESVPHRVYCGRACVCGVASVHKCASHQVWNE